MNLHHETVPVNIYIVVFENLRPHCPFKWTRQITTCSKSCIFVEDWIFCTICYMGEFVFIGFLAGQPAQCITRLPHSKKITEPMLSNWILHQWHFHWGNTCLFLPPTTCFTVTVNEIKDTQFVLLI